MTHKSRKYLFFSLTLVLLALLAGYIGVIYFVNSAKSRLEHEVSSTLGMRVTIDSLDVSLLTSSVSARAIKVDKDDAKIFNADTLKTKLDLSSLLKGQVQITELKMIKPELTVKRLENGTWNIELPVQEKKESTGSPVLPRVFKINDGSLILLDGENVLEMRGISLTVRDIVLAGGNDQPLSSRLSLDGDFNCREMKRNKTVILNFKSHLQGLKGDYTIEPLIFQALGGMANGKVEANLGSKSQKFAAHLQLSGFQVEEVFNSLAKEELLRGPMELEMNLSASGEGREELLRSLNGNVDMTGQNLTITKLDLDALLEEYMQSQHFNLVDLGAFAFLGPLGPALTKSYDFGGVIKASQGGTSEIRQLVSLWRINKGKATANDVAFATRKNRIVVTGGIDIASKRYQKLLVAVIDAEGCALVSQEMNGPFDDPEVKQPSFIESAAGSFINIFKKAAKIITKEKCQSIYNGSVTPPAQ